MKRILAAIAFAVLAAPAFANDANTGYAASGVWADDHNFIAPAK